MVSKKAKPTQEVPVTFTPPAPSLEPEKTVLELLDLSIDDLTRVVKQSPSLYGMLLGYAAEMKLEQMWFAGRPGVTLIKKHDDHDRTKKGDRLVTYKGVPIRIESKSLQTNSIKSLGEGRYEGKAQCDASDRRTIKLPDGSEIETTCLLVGEFDLLAINLFAFEKKWRFVFARNRDLPRSAFRGYTDAQKVHLLASLVPVTWPPQPPFEAEPFRLMDEIVREKAGETTPTTS